MVLPICLVSFLWVSVGWSTSVDTRKEREDRCSVRLMAGSGHFPLNIIHEEGVTPEMVTIVRRELEAVDALLASAFGFGPVKIDVHLALVQARPKGGWDGNSGQVRIGFFRSQHSTRYDQRAINIHEYSHVYSAFHWNAVMKKITGRVEETLNAMLSPPVELLAMHVPRRLMVGQNIANLCTSFYEFFSDLVAILYLEDPLAIYNEVNDEPYSESRRFVPQPFLQPPDPWVHHAVFGQARGQFGSHIAPSFGNKKKKTF